MTYIYFLTNPAQERGSVLWKQKNITITESGDARSKIFNVLIAPWVR